MNAYCFQNNVVQNLRDAGCDEAMALEITECLRSGNPYKAAQLLQKHRRNLLENLHRNQKQIDCLDYLIFMMRKQKES